jgi:hypothetical protein
MKTAKNDPDAENVELTKQDERYPFAVDYAQLRRSMGSATGLSFVDGDPIESVSDLPPYKIEVYRFTNGREAQAFVFGVGVAGLTNTVACTWEPGTSNTVHNKSVIVAFLQEEVEADTPLSERLAVKAFKGNSWDSKAISRTVDESNQRNAENSRKAAEKEAETFAPLYAIGFKKTDAWFGDKYSNPAGVTFDIDWPQGHDEGPYTVTKHCPELRQGSLDVTKEIDEAIAGTGCKFKNSLRNDITVENVSTVEEIPAVVDLITAALDKVEAAKKAAWRAQLERRVKLTPTRRKFLTAAADSGIRQTYHRGDTSLYAGGIKAGRTEMHDLLSIGWIETCDHGYQISAAGREKIGLSLQADSSERK